jgi:uncharacterized protein
VTASFFAIMVVMKIALFSDIHDNLPRLEAAIDICQKKGIKTVLCMGDVSRHETLGLLAQEFEVVYLALGNMDYNLKHQPSIIPENVYVFSEEGGLIELAGKKIFMVHYDFVAQEKASQGAYDLVFYGHTHTPWEKKIGKTIILNPGEISGQFGQATFAIYDLDKMKAELRVIS